MLQQQTTIDVELGERVFTYRLLTTREWKQPAAMQDKIDRKELNALEMIDGMVAAVKTGLVGWSNVTAVDGTAVAFDPDAIEDILTPFDMMKLLSEMLMSQNVSPDEKKNTESPHASVPD